MQIKSARYAKGVSRVPARFNDTPFLFYKNNRCFMLQADLMCAADYLLRFALLIFGVWCGIKIFNIADSFGK